MERRTDLALEQLPTRGADGIRTENIKGAYGVVRTDSIINARGAETSGKNQGIYITIQAARLSHHNPDINRYVANTVSVALKSLLGDAHKVLAIGLGNRMMTSDALGPKVVEKLIVTRHIYADMVKEFGNRLGELSAMTPGVLGLTGIESADVVKGVVAAVKPDAVILIDSLAARASDRICTSVQLTDTGITPGSGIANHRSALNLETLGVKTVCIGVPTVVYASTLTLDLLDKVFQTHPHVKPLPAALNKLRSQILCEDYGDMVVTPKDIDGVLRELADVIAAAVNLAVHRGLNADEVYDCMR